MELTRPERHGEAIELYGLLIDIAQKALRDDNVIGRAAYDESARLRLGKLERVIRSRHHQRFVDTHIDFHEVRWPVTDIRDDAVGRERVVVDVDEEGTAKRAGDIKTFALNLIHRVRHRRSQRPHPVQGLCKHVLTKLEKTAHLASCKQVGDPVARCVGIRAQGDLACRVQLEQAGLRTEHHGLPFADEDVDLPAPLLYRGNGKVLTHLLKQQITLVQQRVQAAAFLSATQRADAPVEVGDTHSQFVHPRKVRLQQTADGGELLIQAGVHAVEAIGERTRLVEHNLPVRHGGRRCVRHVHRIKELSYGLVNACELTEKNGFDLPQLIRHGVHLRVQRLIRAHLSHSKLIRDAFDPIHARARSVKLRRLNGANLGDHLHTLARVAWGVRVGDVLASHGQRLLVRAEAAHAYAQQVSHQSGTSLLRQTTGVDPRIAETRVSTPNSLRSVP